MLLRPIMTTFNREKLHEEFDAMFGVGVARHGYDTSDYVLVTNETITLQDVQGIIDVHNPEMLTTTQQEAAQADSAKNRLQQLKDGLNGVPAIDKGYVVLARIMAQNDGANQATIDAIVDRITAVSYVTGTIEWQNLTQPNRQFQAKVLEAQAVSLSAIIAVLK